MSEIRDRPLTQSFNLSLNSPLGMNFGRLFKSKPTPRIAESPPVNYLDLRSKPYYIVASVEVGNTTTKCILTATDMNTGKTYIVNKTVKMTRDVRLPKSGEEVSPTPSMARL